MCSPVRVDDYVLIDAGTEELGALRDRCDALLHSFGIEPAVRADAVLALSELVDNARRHGRPGEVSIVIEHLRDEWVELTVTNHGDRAGVPATEAWVLPDPLAASGRGLAIVARVADDVAVGGDDHTTEVRARFALVADR